MNDLQKRVVDAGREVFGEANMNSRRERALRFGEEAMELMRAAGLTHKDMASLLCWEFTRPVGEIKQEIAGTQVTLYGLAEVHGIDAYEVTVKEMNRILEKKDLCRVKHAAKPGILKAASAA